MGIKYHPTDQPGVNFMPSAPSARAFRFARCIHMRNKTPVMMNVPTLNKPESNSTPSIRVNSSDSALAAFPVGREAALERTPTIAAPTEIHSITFRIVVSRLGSLANPVTGAEPMIGGALDEVRRSPNISLTGRHSGMLCFQ